jgi:parallel beta-helix repeat protein
VRNNTASNNSAWGIHFWSTRNSQVIGNRVANNIRQCTWGSGVTDWGCDAAGIILQMGSSHNLITDNWVAGRNGNGIFLKAHDQPCGNDNQIVGNTIEDDFYNGIELSFCSRNNIIGNQIRGGFDGIWIGFARDSEIRDNTFMNLKNHGIVSPNSQRIVISGNRFINTNEGVSFFSWEENDFDWLPSGDYTSQNNCFVGNTFRSNAIAIHLKNSRNNQFADNVFQGNGLNILAELQKGGKYVRRELDDGPIPFLDDDYDRWGSEK